MCPTPIESNTRLRTGTKETKDRLPTRQHVIQKYRTLSGLSSYYTYALKDTFDINYATSHTYCVVNSLSGSAIFDELFSLSSFEETNLNENATQQEMWVKREHQKIVYKIAGT